MDSVWAAHVDSAVFVLAVDIPLVAMAVEWVAEHLQFVFAY